MNTFEIVILALALVLSSWSSYLNAAVVLAREPFFQRVRYAGITFSVQLLLTGAGLYIGNKLSSPDLKVNMLISLSILLIFGLKVILSGIRQQNGEKSYNYAEVKVVLLAAVAEAITPLAVGIGIGLLSEHPFTHWIVIGSFFFAGIFTALIVASAMGVNSLRLRFGPIGGLLLLAAALKLILSITGYGF